MTFVRGRAPPPHGVVFVAYDAEGNGKVVADQGDFHGGVDPRNGKPLL